MISLVQPSIEYLDSFFPAMAEFEEEGRPQVPAGFRPDQFPAYVQRLLDLAAGRNLPEGYIPSLEFWIVDEDGYAGRIILGLTYTPSPDRLGHHVGYAIRPSRRRRGYATQALRLLLEEARQRGIHRPMPTCGRDNIASQTVIQANGGTILPDPEPSSSAELKFLIVLD